MQLDQYKLLEYYDSKIFSKSVLLKLILKCEFGESLEDLINDDRVLIFTTENYKTVLRWEQLPVKAEGIRGLKINQEDICKAIASLVEGIGLNVTELQLNLVNPSEQLTLDLEKVA